MTMLLHEQARAPAPIPSPTPSESSTPASPSTPNQLAQQITGRPYLSHSQLSLMRSCPQSFAFRYVEKAPPQFLASSLLFGGAIHHALDLHYCALLEGLRCTPQALYSAYLDGWTSQHRQTGEEVPIRYNQKEDREQLDELAQRLLASFLASPIAHPKGRILGVEEELKVTLSPDLPDLVARVDLATQTEDGLNVVDFKTSRSRWNEQRAAEAGDQLLLYGLTLGRMSRYLGLPLKLHFAILTKAKTPVVQVLAVPTDADRVAAIQESVSAVWHAIQSGNFYPAPSPMHCGTCPYRDRCPVFGGK